jgi:hypothetical protein
MIMLVFIFIFFVLGVEFCDHDYFDLKTILTRLTQSQKCSKVLVQRNQSFLATLNLRSTVDVGHSVRSYGLSASSRARTDLRIRSYRVRSCNRYSSYRSYYCTGLARDSRMSTMTRLLKL